MADASIFLGWSIWFFQVSMLTVLFFIASYTWKKKKIKIFFLFINIYMGYTYITEKWENHSSWLLFSNNVKTSVWLVHTRLKKIPPHYSLSCSLFILAKWCPARETTRLCCFKMDARHICFFLFYDSSLMSKSHLFLLNLFFFYLPARSPLGSSFSLHSPR